MVSIEKYERHGGSSNPNQRSGWTKYEYDGESQRRKQHKRFEESRIMRRPYFHVG